MVYYSIQISISCFVSNPYTLVLCKFNRIHENANGLQPLELDGKIFNKNKLPIKSRVA